VSVIDNPGLDFETETSYDLTIEIEDTGGLTDTAVLTVDINDINEPPEITNLPDSVSVSEDDAGLTTLFTVVATDPEGDTPSFSIASVSPSSSSFAITSGDGVVSTVNNPGLDYETSTSYVLTISTTDGSVSSTQDLTVNLIDVNEHPSITSALTVSVPEGTTGTIYTITATDPEGAALTYAWTVSFTPLSGATFTLDAAGNSLVLFIDLTWLADYRIRLKCISI